MLIMKRIYGLKDPYACVRNLRLRRVLRAHNDCLILLITSVGVSIDIETKDSKCAGSFKRKGCVREEDIFILMPETSCTV